MRRVHWIICAALTISACASGCGLSVEAGSESYMLRENKLGTAVAVMEDVTIKAWKLQADKTVRVEKVTIKTHTVIRVGVQFICREDQILTTEEKSFDAMVPDKDGKLVKSSLTVDQFTGIKIGTATWPETEGGK